MQYRRSPCVKGINLHWTFPLNLPIRHMQICAERLHQVLAPAACIVSSTSHHLWSLSYQMLSSTLTYKLIGSLCERQVAPRCFYSSWHTHMQLHALRHPSFLVFLLVPTRSQEQQWRFRVKAAYATSATFDQSRLFIARCVCDAGQSL